MREFDMLESVTRRRFTFSSFGIGQQGEDSWRRLEESMDAEEGFVTCSAINVGWEGTHCMGRASPIGE